MPDHVDAVCECCEEVRGTKLGIYNGFPLTPDDRLHSLKCVHHFSLEAIQEHIQAHPGHRAKCPVPGCGSVLMLSDLRVGRRCSCGRTSSKNACLLADARRSLLRSLIQHFRNDRIMSRGGYRFGMTRWKMMRSWWNDQWEEE